MTNPDPAEIRAARKAAGLSQVISAKKFDALAELLRLQNGVRREAARLVLVDGMKPADAARQAGTTPQTVNSALVSCRRGIALAQIVAGTSIP